jgi:hypothetical protein
MCIVRKCSVSGFPSNLLPFSGVYSDLAGNLASATTTTAVYGAFGSFVDFQDCTAPAASFCAAQNREACHVASFSCGACLPNFVGINGPANSSCWGPPVLLFAQLQSSPVSILAVFNASTDLANYTLQAAASCSGILTPSTFALLVAHLRRRATG